MDTTWSRIARSVTTLHGSPVPCRVPPRPLRESRPNPPVPDTLGEGVGSERGHSSGGDPRTDGHELKGFRDGLVRIYLGVVVRSVSTSLRLGLYTPVTSRVHYLSSNFLTFTPNVNCSDNSWEGRRQEVTEPRVEPISTRSNKCLRHKGLNR